MAGAGLIAVTGVTGGLGGRVARRLAERGVRQRLVARDPGRAPKLAGAEVVTASYDDRDGLRKAFQGARTLFMVSATEHPERLELHANVVEAAADAGVERVIYTSIFGRGRPAPTPSGGTTGTPSSASSAAGCATRSCATACTSTFCR